MVSPERHPARVHGSPEAVSVATAPLSTLRTVDPVPTATGFTRCGGSEVSPRVLWPGAEHPTFNECVDAVMAKALLR